MRFYLDECLSDRSAEIGRQRGLDITSSHESSVKQDGSDDDRQLLLAAQDGRCIVTKNGLDFEILTASFMARALPHAGVLVLPSSLDGSEFGLIVDRLAHWHQMYPDGVPAYFFGYV